MLIYREALGRLSRNVKFARANQEAARQANDAAGVAANQVIREAALEVLCETLAEAVVVLMSKVENLERELGKRR